MNQKVIIQKRTQNKLIYYSLSIAAYSTKYWKKKYESENK